MKIRPATRDDLAALRQIHLQNWRSGHRGIMADEFLGEPLEQEMSRRWSDLPPAEDLLRVAESDAGIAGFALVRCGHRDGPLLESLHVSATARGGGVGKRLMQAIVSELETRGLGRLWLVVLRDNRGARRFYTRLGGREGPVFMENVAGQQVAGLQVQWPSLREFPGD